MEDYEKDIINKHGLRGHGFLKKSLFTASLQTRAKSTWFSRSLNKSGIGKIVKYAIIKEFDKNP
ncbi:hypothetical protein A2714_00415 [Candidatus Woesebacteria bacterium RIFCSPHIGHO2_01_FULL_38_9]|uniref:Uncharacterized protein n=2 Tax=Candidatus Woeseibacteriota TaxID=1752722 RepID=A0A1F7Y0Q8_9BACT|nr:MAG: hypothetical protein A2714_00415 [Candidatus Woesebacteria bacterium RIFCSPHIGHO2_01_FULL_38_9]OGM58299.1 MAG: hypothetical protein A3A75_04680 [Candidatus Woesebacteria bacterium RIFCSPLOWO2_01_FULL_39_10]